MANINQSVIVHGKDFAKAVAKGTANAALVVVHDVTHPIEWSKDSALAMMETAKFIFSEMAKQQAFD
jgi:hypothetical protein